VAEVIERIADGIWVGIPGAGEAAMGAIVRDERMIVVDTSCYGTFAAQFIEHVERVEGKSAQKLLLITHRHVDHFAGADRIPAPAVAHRLTRAAMATYTDEWLTATLDAWRERGMILPAPIENPRIVLPEITFADQVVVHAGRTEVRMLHVGGHCVDQCVVYLPGERILFGSDDVFNGKPPYVGEGDLVTWITSLRELAMLPLEIVVPGHGPVGGPELVDAQILELEELLSLSRKEIV
jgi:cyclase